MAGRKHFLRSLSLGLLSVVMTAPLAGTVHAQTGDTPAGVSLEDTAATSTNPVANAQYNQPARNPNWVNRNGLRLASDVYANPPLQGYPNAPHAPTIVANPHGYHTAVASGDVRPGVPYYDAHRSLTTHIDNSQSWWDPEGPLERTIAHWLHRTSFRLEYFQVNVGKPGTVLLGSPIDGVARPQDGFQVVDPNDPTQTLDGRVFTTENIDLLDIPGIKFTYSVPLTFGGFELGFWGTQQATRHDFARDLTDGAIDFVATSTFVNGAPAANVELYDTSFDLYYTTDVWNLDAIVWFDNNGYAGPINLRPLVGWQFMRFQEEMNQIGVFTGNGGPGLPLTSRIDSDTNNLLYGAVFGVRAEASFGERLMMMVEPRATLGFNTYTANVHVRDFRSQNDNRSTQVGETRFNAILSLSVSGRLKVHDNFYLTAGVHAMWISTVARASNQIFYDDNGDPPVPPGVVAQDNMESVTIFGFTVGGEFTFP